MESLALGASDFTLNNFLAGAVLNLPELEGRALGFCLADGMACVDALTVRLVPSIFTCCGRGF